MNKYDTSLTVTVDASNINVDDTVGINVKVVNLNDASVVPTGNVTVLVFGQNITIELDENGEGSNDNVAINKEGSYYIGAAYAGD